MSDPAVTLSDLVARVDSLHARLDALTAQLPPEPLYSLLQATLLLYVSSDYLNVLLRVHRAALSEPRYRHDSRHRRHRMLTAGDLAFLRSKLVRPSRKRMSTAQREALAQSAA